MLAAISVLDWIEQNPSAGLAGAVVLIGLLGLGLKDLLRFSPTRTLAIASVNFRQAIRRRVLWITLPLMLAVVIINQFQRPLDPQDAMRQTTMICLFATGLLVTLIIIMLACTSLPHEIDSRVIYTVATKPTTRLEMVLGKIAGFAGVSFCILLIMGLFTWGYLSLRDWQMRKVITAQLANPGQITDALRPTLEYYRDNGTLHARTLGLPQSLGVYAHAPKNDSDRWSPGGDEGEMAVRFTLDRSLLPPAALRPDLTSPVSTMGPTPPQQPSLLLQVPVLVRKLPAAAPAPTTSPTTAPAAPDLPRVGISITELVQNTFLSSKDLDHEQGWEISGNGSVLRIPILPSHLERLFRSDAAQVDVDLTVIGYHDDYEYSIDPTGLGFIVPGTRLGVLPSSDIAFAGRSGQYGQQLRGGRAESPRVAVYRFADQKLDAGARETYAFELRMGVERVEDAVQSKVTLDFYNRTTGKHVGPVVSMVETNRPAYVNVPAEAVQGGNFDVHLHSPSEVWLGLQAEARASVKLIKEDQSFAWNLAKSLSIFWFLSLLVIIISVFCSTFLSWPIAVVLTVVILMGHWAADQVSDIAQPGVGRQIVNDMMRDSNAATSNAVSKSVDVLVSMLHTVSAVLPDIGKFSALQDIQQGLSVSPTLVLLPSLLVLLNFGLPLMVLSYVFLKYKEVAP
ncbi:MAG TPA: hypothetical protein VHP11_14315 [Tepidisphaeraceae bacterium]|nr:hypothetical protein [Tepidisphaeraceae bacterium]